MILACTVLIQLTSVTDRRLDDGKDAQSILLLRVKIKNIRFVGNLIPNICENFDDDIIIVLTEHSVFVSYFFYQ